MGNSDDYELLKAVRPYVRQRPPAWRSGGALEEGRRPPALDAVSWVVRLEQSYIPTALVQVLRGGATRRTLNTIRAQYVTANMTIANHAHHFQALLWIEEYRLR